MEWLAARDDLYEQIMHKAWNADQKFFGQSYEDKEILDSSLMIMPLVFFCTPVCVGSNVPADSCLILWIVRSTFLEHVETNSAVSGERRVDFQRTFVCILLCYSELIHVLLRASSSVTMLRSRMMVLEARKGRFVCARSGTTAHLLGLFC